MKSMQNKDKTDWQILGQLKLPVGSNADDPIRIWLMEILAPINLPVNFLDKILKSAQDSARRAMQAESLMKFEHIHLIIFVPSGHVSKRRTWGFFRIEKAETPSGDGKPVDHSIELYLYLEGQ